MINRRCLFSNNEDTSTYILNFQYTGAAQDVILTKGTYKLECWGAEGGANSAYSSYNITSQAGGKGGYSVGQLTVSNNTAIKVYVGGQGTSSSGGFNGGGSTSSSSSYGNTSSEYGISRMGGGGGATDIRLSDGALLSRMIVAGGGAGGAMCYQYKTTTTTNWKNLGTRNYSYSGSKSSDGNQNIYSWNGNYQEPALLEDGKTYKFSVSPTTNISYIAVVQYRSDGSFITGTDLTVPNNSSFTFNKHADSHHSMISIYSSTLGVSSYTLTLYERETSTSTSTSTDYQVGGYGGGTSGGGYSTSYVGKQNAAGSGGSFGQGANQTITNYRYCSGAGGGGWYGGGGGQYSDYYMTYCKYSGGGSGFVNIAASAGNRPSGYTGLQLDSGSTTDGSSSFPAPGGGNETGHSGNGYARITKLIICSVKLHFRTINNEPVEGLSVIITGTNETHSLTTNSDGKISFNTSLEGSSKTYAISCPGYTTSIRQFIVSKNIVLSILVEEGLTLDYEYIGVMQSRTLKAGTYKLECWGGQGGYRSNSTYGGKGGYSVGELTLTQDTLIYVYVGGSGNTGGTSGGFNGGGIRHTYVGGGGASDIRIGQDSLYARVIVAGGGGSDGKSSYAGSYGGGINGGAVGSGCGTVRSGYGTQTGVSGGNSYLASSKYTTANPTTYAATYAGFGFGGAGAYYASGYGGGGGGGWYGGGGCYPDGSVDDDKGGCGGSGYVYTSSTASNYPSGCLLNSTYYLSNAQTIAGNQSFPSPSGGTETGHTGNGYIRITKI